MKSDGVLQVAIALFSKQQRHMVAPVVGLVLERVVILLQVELDVTNVVAEALL